MNYAEFNAMTFSAIETAHSSLRRDAEFDPWDQACIAGETCADEFEAQQLRT